MKKQSKAARERRKKHREGFTEFYEKHAQMARKQRYCENCGARLRGVIAEVAHILPKQLFKSVATNDNNVLYLGSSFTSNCNCHDLYDSSWSKAKSMPVWEIAVERFKRMEEDIEENSFMILKHFWDE